MIHVRWPAPGRAAQVTVSGRMDKVAFVAHLPQCEVDLCSCDPRAEDQQKGSRNSAAPRALSSESSLQEASILHRWRRVADRYVLCSSTFGQHDTETAKLGRYLCILSDSHKTRHKDAALNSHSCAQTLEAITQHKVDTHGSPPSTHPLQRRYLR